MDIVSTFNPISATSGQFDMTIQQGGHLLVANESSANLLLKFGNGAQTYVPANDRRLYCISGQMAQPHTIVTWTQQSTLPNPNTVNQTVIEAFQPGENVPETYPSPVIRNTSVAGSITATALNLQVAMPPTVPVITVTNTTTGFNNVQLTSDGRLILGGINYPGGISLVDTTLVNNAAFNSGFLELVVPNTSTNAAFRILNDSTAVVIAEIDANGTFIQNTGSKIVTQLLDASVIPSGSADLGFHVDSTHRIVDTVVGVGDIVQSNSTGFSLLHGTLSFLHGSISRISVFGPYTLSTTSTAFNHNLGAVPDFIILTRQGTSNAVETAGYDTATLNATTVNLVANGSFTFIGLAIKF